MLHDCFVVSSLRFTTRKEALLYSRMPLVPSASLSPHRKSLKPLTACTITSRRQKLKPETLLRRRRQEAHP